MIILISLLLIFIVSAVDFRQVYNPFTRALDYYRTGNFSGESVNADNFSSDYYLNSSGDEEWIGPENIYDVDKADIEGDLNTFLDVAGDTWEGNQDANNFNITNLGNEIYLNVNSSLSLNTSIGYIKNINDTQFNLINSILSLDESWLDSVITFLGYIKDLTGFTTDDLSEGSTNKYDNQSWNENYLLNKENTFTENQTFLNYTCYNADCSARIYHNGSGIMIES